MNKYLKELSLPESFVSITLGFLVVIVAGLLMYNYLTKNRAGKTNEELAKSNKAKMEEVAVLPTSHTIAEGETLWSIAEKYYHSGYNWTTLAKANNLMNADDVKAGDSLVIPVADTIRPESENISSAQTAVERSYTVNQGDNLWNIAVREYGDGFAWTKIASFNNLANPDIIHAGNVLKLPAQ